MNRLFGNFGKLKGDTQRLLVLNAALKPPTVDCGFVFYWRGKGHTYNTDKPVKFSLLRLTPVAVFGARTKANLQSALSGFPRRNTRNELRSI